MPRPRNTLLESVRALNMRCRELTEIAPLAVTALRACGEISLADLLDLRVRAVQQAVRQHDGELIHRGQKPKNKEK